ncbi:MAG: hypothetical protein U0528_08570 [Anaerolineae bacterium]|nr:hypothetical protein [Anaerolineae bacterium]
MFKRVLGLLIIVSLLMPPFLAYGTVTVARGVADDLDAAAQQRVQHIRQELVTLRNSVKPLVNALGAVRTTLNGARGKISAALMALSLLGSQITIPAITIPPITFARRTIVIPDIPPISLGTIEVLGVSITLPTFPGFAIPDVTIGPFTLTVPTIPSFTLNVPWLETVVSGLRDAYGSIDQIISSVIDVTGVDSVITSLDHISSETEGFVDDISSIRDRWSDPLRGVGIGLAVWLVIAWLALLGSVFGYGWRLLMGHA